MKKFITLALPLLILFAAGCEQKPNVKRLHESYVNHDAEVCGVTDPVENIDWLNKIYRSWTKQSNEGVNANFTMSVYRLDSTGVDYFILKTHELVFFDSEDYFLITIYGGYDCDQNMPFEGGEWSAPQANIPIISGTETTQRGPAIPCDDCGEFFMNSTYLYDLVKFTNFSMK
ncbi:MAG: hypothetical protein ACI3Z7_00670 [Candidatus Aphodosoma sp.]